MGHGRLPRCEDAVIPPAKLRDYALDPTHPDGSHKSRVFRSALGIGQKDWEWFRDRILEKVQYAEVASMRLGPHGYEYRVPIVLEGLNGKTRRVITGWHIQAVGEVPTLDTVYVDRIRNVMAKGDFKLLDVVELATDVGHWRPGTTGTIVETFDDAAALVEIVATDGCTLDILDVSYRVLRHARGADQKHLPA